MKKLLLILINLSFLGGSVLAANHFQQGFNGTSTPSGWTANSMYYNTTANHGTFTGADGAGFNAVGDWLQTPAVNTAGTLSFWIKGSSSPSKIEMKIQKSTNGTDWTDVVTYPQSTFSTTWVNKSVDINDGSSSIYIRFYISSRSGNSLYLDDIQLTDYSSSSPTITLSTNSLSDFSYVQGSGPSAEQNFTVEGSNLTNDISVTAPTDYEISETSGSGFTNSLTLTQSGGSVATTTLYVRLKAGLSAGDYNGEAITASSTNATDKTVTCDGTVYKQEPTNQVSNFAVGSPTSSTIPLTWNDNDGTVVADGYLLMINTTGTFTDPVDGTPQNDDTDVSDGSGVVNVGHGVHAYTWTGLSSETQYHFKIFAYTNSGAAINYKTDGAPTVDATTAAPAAEPQVGDLKISEVNSTHTANASYVEIYNTTANELNLENVDLVYYNNGASSATSTLHLTGSIAAHSYIVIARAASDFNTAYGFNPDFVFSGMYINGGADGLVLKHDSNGNLDYFNDAPTPSVSWTDNHLFYRYDFSSDGSSLANDWDDAGYERNGTPKAPNSLTWKTDGTADWGTGSNWSNGDVPSKGVDVVIPSGGTQPSADGTTANPGECMNLTINSGATFTVPVGEYLTIHKNLTNNGTLIIKSTSSGNGSLIVHGTVTGNATVERYVQKYLSKDDHGGWQFLSAPVADFTISGSDFAPTSGDDDLYEFDETASSNNWLNYIGGTFSDTKFEVGKGYLISYKTAGTKNFTGVINTGNVSKSLSFTSTSPYKGWNLLGNPYTAAIDWDNINKSSSVDGSVYVIQASDGSYISWNGSTGDLSDGIIPAMNGFFVHATATGQTVTMEPADEVHSSTANYKQGTVSAPATLKITVSGDNGSSNEYIQFRSDATTAFDQAIDAYKLFGFSNAPQIYTTDGTTKYSINCLPENITNYDLPLSIKHSDGGVYTLSFSGVEKVKDYDIKLEDLRTHEITPITAGGTYSFSLTKEESPDCFVLHINGVTAVPDVNAADRLHIFSYGKTIYLNAQKALNGKVTVYNLMGQKVYESPLNGANKQQFRLDREQGIYFVKVEEAGRTSTHKVFIK